MWIEEVHRRPSPQQGPLFLSTGRIGHRVAVTSELRLLELLYAGVAKKTGMPLRVSFPPVLAVKCSVDLFVANQTISTGKAMLLLSRQAAADVAAAAVISADAAIISADAAINIIGVVVAAAAARSVSDAAAAPHHPPPS